MKMMNDLNDLIIDLEARLLQDKFNKECLIKESFVLWYTLIEGERLESFAEEDLKVLLMRNVGIYQNTYTDDADYNFIIGWMLGVSFWYFDPLIKDEDGIKLLNKAYRSNPKNSLFKWAIRNELGLKHDEIEGIKTDILLRFDQLYNYGALIKEYFLDVINGSLAK